MSDFHVEGIQTVAGTTDTTLTLEIASATRFKIYEFSSGFQLASPSDNLMLVTGQRFGTTNDGTGDARIPNPLDPADAAAITTCLTNHSAEPSSYVSAKEVWGPLGVHMRATYRWVATPGKEIISSVTANTGVGFFADHASATPDHTITLYFTE